MVTIVTGDKNTGKTTWLFNWYQTDLQGCGVLTQKHFCGDLFVGYDLLLLPGGEHLPFCRIPDYQSDLGTCAFLSQGRFVFSQKTFTQAISYVQDALKSNTLVWLDEIGYMELKKQGFYSLLSQVINEEKEIRMVVRKNIVDDIITCFHLTPDKVIVLS